MDQQAFLLATVDIASPWDVADTPLMAIRQGLEQKPQCSVSYCPVCGNKAMVFDAKEEQRRHLNTLLSEAYLHVVAPSVATSNKVQGRKKIEVPWARPGTIFTQLFEALFMAMVRRMSLNAAAALLENRDSRLWRVVDQTAKVGKKTASCPETSASFIDLTSSRKGPDYLSLFYDLDVSFDIQDKDCLSAKAFAEDLNDKEKVGNLDLVTTDLSKAFFIAVIDALLRASRCFGRSQVLKDKKDALGKVSAEEGMLNPGKSRAPPQAAR